MAMTRFSRPAGSNRPFQPKLRDRIQIVSKEVFLGNHRPTDHFAPAAQAFIPAEELYDNQRPRKRRGF